MQTQGVLDSDDMARGGYRENAGRPSAFPGTTDEKPFYMDFTPAGYRALTVLKTRTGLSRNSIIAHLVERHAETLAFDKDGVVYEGKRASNVMAIRLPAKQRKLLKAAHERTGKGYSDLGEVLVRKFAKDENWPVMPDNRKPVKLRGRKRGRRG